MQIDMNENTTPKEDREQDDELESATPQWVIEDAALGKHTDVQVEAWEILADHGPLPYDEWRARLGVEQSKAQAVIRGMRWNGLLESDRTGGELTFSAGDGRD